MHPKLLALFLLFFVCNAVAAQTVALQINLKAPGKDSVPGATVQVYTLPGNTLLQQKLSGNHNIFRVKPNSTYRVMVIAVGYDTLRQNFTVADKPLIISVLLVPIYKKLQDVTVVSSKPLMRQVDDKTMVDAEQLANSSTNAYEVLEKVPGVVLDQDGNVYLNSSTPASIYLNGVQMHMGTDDIAALLKSLPAGSVERIEIIRTPSARYDAANSGGIVNIVLKKGVQVGTSGSVNARTDQGVYNNTTAGITLNRSAGKLREYLSYQYTRRKYFDDIQSNRAITADTALAQKSNTGYSPITNYFGGGIGKAFTSKFDVSYDFRITATHNSSLAHTYNTISNTKAQDVLLQTQSPISSGGNALVLNNTVFAKYKIDSAGSEWDNEVDYVYTHNTNAQTYTQVQNLPQYAEVAGNGDNNSHSNLVSAKSDLLLRLPHAFTIETGLKYSSAGNNNMALYHIKQGSQPRNVDSFKTNTFTYQENIGSAYTQLSKLYHGYLFRAGVRLEYTDISGHQTTPEATPFAIKRTDLFPYFYIKRNLFTIFTYPLVGNMVFRRSIARPEYEELNPAPQFVDQFTYNTGNPNLQPQFTTNYEVNATYNDFPVFAIGVNNTSNVYNQVSVQNPATGIAYRTYENLGQKKEFYGRLFGGVPGGHRYFMYVGMQFSNVNYQGQYNKGPLDYSRTSWTFFTGHQFKVTPTFSLNLNGWMLVNGFRMFNQLKTMGQLNLSVTKNLLHKKLSIIAACNDLLHTNKSVFLLQQNGITVNGTRLQDTRRAAITIRYNFGINHTEEKKPVYTPPVDNGGQAN